MRLISQDGCYDIPYDMTLLTLDGRHIVAGVIGEETTIVMGEYRDDLDARRVLDAIHKHYGLMDIGVYHFPAYRMTIKALE